MCDDIDNNEVGNDHDDNASLNFGLLKTIGFPIKSDQFVSFINFEYPYIHIYTYTDTF